MATWPSIAADHDGSPAPARHSFNQRPSRMTHDRAVASMTARLRARQELALARALWRADAPLTVAWWLGVLLRGALPAVLAVTSGWLVGAVTDGTSTTAPLIAVGVVFVLAQVVGPLHEAMGYNLGDRTSTSLNDRLMAATLAPPGIAHLERADLASDLSMARDFDLGITGPPLSYGMNFIADGLVYLVVGAASAIVLLRFGWWQAIVLVLAWSSTHWMLRESAVWRDRNTPEVQSAQRHADYAYRLAVDPPAAKEVRLFGLADWVIERFARHRRHLLDLQHHATRLRERSVASCLAIVLVANGLVFWTLAARAVDGRLELADAVVALQAAVGVSAIAFGGLSWALDGAAAPVAAVARLEATMPSSAQLDQRTTADAPTEPGPGPELRFDDVSFAYPGGPPVLEHLDLTVPAGSSLAIVGQNGAGKTTLAKLICRLYDPTGGAIRADGTDLRELRLAEWRRRVTAVFQDFVRFELPLRANVAPAGADDDVVLAALAAAGGHTLSDLATTLAKGYPGGTDLSGGQWQRVALARALCAVELGADVVLLDEPTAQLDVRGEAEIFERILAATRGCTTILVSHRFSTVRHADHICVLEHGAVVEFGSHDELIDLGGRYRTMFDLQASRFVELDEHGEEVVHDTLG
jgi:ABC-type multidrug transport system fused ATPase/permease subunit